jgi:hypothetical protein
MPNVVPRYQAFVVIAVLDAVVAGATAGIAMIGLDVGTAATIALGILVFAVTLLGFAAWGVRSIGRYRESMDVRFPSPAA